MREDALHRDFTVTFSAEAYNDRVDERLTSLIPQVNVPGFRPGKVPLKVMRQRYADRVRGEVIEQIVDATTQDLLKENNLRPAMQPKLEIKEFDPAKGLTFTVAVILSGEFELVDVKTIDLKKYKIAPAEAEINAALERLQKDMRTSKALAKKRKSRKGDLVIIDFAGTVDGVAFDGGSAEDVRLELGSGQMIPGFEEQIIGMSKGDSGDITVTFPDQYQQASLAGKEAVFAITVKDVHAFELAPLDDEMARQVGLESLEQLKEQISNRISGDYGKLSEEHLRRELFDRLDAAHSVEIADEMFEAEYAQLEADYSQAREGGRLASEEMEQPEEEALEELKNIACRRVRLALILAKFGEKFQVEVTENDTRQQLMTEARNYPGQEQAFVQHIQQNQQAQQQLHSRAQESAIVRVMVELINPEEVDINFADFQKLTAEVEQKPKVEAEAQKSRLKKTKKPAAKKTAVKETAVKETTKEAAKDGDKKPAARKSADKKAPAKKAVRADKE